jgi:protein-S-isoprenylcysteine O-methyltransferase Ste14
VRLSQFPKPYADFVARLRVPSGFLLVAAFAWFAHPSPPSLALGLPVSLAGLALRAWAAGHLTKDRQLTTGGPYAYVRNPLYLGTLLVAVGLTVACRSAGLAIGVLFFFVFIYLPVIMLEEQHLGELFPKFELYANTVPALFPYRKPRSTGSRFSAALYKKNREYQALLAFMAGILWLLYRSS